MEFDLIIPSKRTYLRPLVEDDAAPLFAYRADPQIYRYQLWQPKQIADAEDFIQKWKFHGELINNRWNQMAICLKSTDELIGDCGINLADDKAEIGFTLSPSYQGRGLAFESVSALINHLFFSCSLVRISAITDAQNVPSINLLCRLGFLNDSSLSDDNTLYFYLRKSGSEYWSTQ